MARAALAAGPSTLPPLVAPGRSGEGARWAGGFGRRGLHRLALRRGGDRCGRLRSGLGEPADTQAARGRKHHAKTDRSDARLLRELLQSGDLPESWIPPEAVLEWRERVRLYKSLVDQRTQWIQRIHAELYQHGVAVPEGAIRSDKTRALLASDAVDLSAAARQRITVGYRMIEATDAQVLPSRRTCNPSVAVSRRVGRWPTPTTASAG